VLLGIFEPNFVLDSFYFGQLSALKDRIVAYLIAPKVA